MNFQKTLMFYFDNLGNFDKVSCDEKLIAAGLMVQNLI